MKSAPAFLFADDHRHPGVEISFQVHKVSLGQKKITMINISLQIWMIVVTTTDSTAKFSAIC